MLNWVGMGAEVGGSDPAADHESDMRLIGVDVRADKGTTSADHPRVHPAARPASGPPTTGSRGGFVPVPTRFVPARARFVTFLVLPLGA